MSVVSPTISVTVYAAPVPELSVNVDKTTGYIGDTFTFFGTHVQDTTPVPGAEIILYKNGVEVGRSITDAAGGYSILWIADVEGTFSFHTETEAPPLPPLSSPSLGVTVGLPAIPPEIDLPVIGGIALAVVDAALIVYYIATHISRKP